MKPFRFALAALAAASSTVGCGGADNGGPDLATPSATSSATSSATPTPMETPKTASLQLVTVTDPWEKARPRWRDIENNLYAPEFREGPAAFRYGNAVVTLSYEREPSTPYFKGRIVARGLKPNFAYQLKLAGKPIFGSRGFGATGSIANVSSRLPDARPVLAQRFDTARQPLAINADDWTNQQLGYAGRWWDDTQPPGTNLDDNYFKRFYGAHTIYGYIFMGDFVTDEFGRANVEIASGHSYHITWQDRQNGIENALAGDFIVRSGTAPFVGYGRPISSTRARLWYEFEAARPNIVRLRAGVYHCRLMVTEEAFHTSGGEDGGVWQSVLATEDAGDRSASNDVVFTVR